MIKILQDFILMLPFKKLKDGLFLLLKILIMMQKKLKETATENIFSKSKYKQLQLIDGRNFGDQPINDQIKKYEEIRKSSKRQGDDYKTIGCLLDYQYFKNHFQLIAVDLSKQKSSDADPRAIQQIEFYGMLKTNSQVCTILEKLKETVLEFYKETGKVL